MEIVFVNDGSTDGTLGMLQSYCRKHPDNTVLINREINGGTSQARNDALKVARGRWITFFDPDDALSSGAYQALFNDYLDDNVDILSFGTNIVLDAEILPIPHYKGQVVWEGSSKDFYEKFSTNVVWSFIYSHELFEKWNVSFQDVSLLEGELFNLDLFLNDGIRVRQVDCKPYYFNYRRFSLSSIDVSELNTKKIEDIMNVLEYMEQKKLDEKDEQLTFGITRKQTVIARRLTPLFIRCEKVSAEEINYIRRQLKKWSAFPYKPIIGGVKDTFYDMLFRFPGLLVSIRPLMMKFIGR